MVIPYYLINILNILSAVAVIASLGLTVVTYYQSRSKRAAISSELATSKDLSLIKFDSKINNELGSLFETKELTKYYQESLRQLRPLLIFSLIALCLGTLVLASLFLITLTSNTTTNAILLFAGYSLLSLALFSFRKVRREYKQVDNYYANKLSEVRKISRLISFVTTLSDIEVRDRLTETIILKLLLPASSREPSLNAFTASLEKQ